MTQIEETLAAPPPQSASTCADCPQFRDFRDTRERGWCPVFDRVTRIHHRRTRDCDLNIEIYLQSKKVLVELLSYKTEEGEKGKVIADVQIIELTLTEVSKDTVEKAIASYPELSEYYLGGFWKPEGTEF